VVPAGFVEAAEKLGLLSAPSASSGPREELEEPPSVAHSQPDEKPPVAERLSTAIETPSSPPAVPETIFSVSSPSSIQPCYEVPESVLAEVASNDSQTIATSGSLTHPESSKPSAPISVPQAASVLESFQESPWSSAPQHQNSTFWDNNMNDAQAFHYHQQDIQNALYLGSTGDDIDMEFSGAITIEPTVYSLPTMWTSPRPQPEHQTFYPHVDQVVDNNNHYQTYTMDNIHPNWASMVSIPSPVPLSVNRIEAVRWTTAVPVSAKGIHSTVRPNKPTTI